MSGGFMRVFSHTENVRGSGFKVNSGGRLMHDGSDGSSGGT